MTQNKRIYAITGGIGCGKSAVSAMICGEGYPVFSCDGIYAELTASGGRLVALLEREFGGVTAADGSLDRSTMSDIVFNNDEARRKLDAMTHPIIMDELMTRAKSAEGGLAFCEVPLLFENGFEKLFDGVIVVMRSLEERIKSVSARSGLNREQILARIHSQCDYSALDLKSCYTIYNDGDMEQLREKVKKILQNIAKLT